VLMLDPRRLTTLQAVVRAGSFARAAGELNYTQAAVSQHIAELERAVGLRLLERRPVRPTPAGELALAAAEAAGHALAAAETGLRALRDGEAGRLRIAAFSSAARELLPPALATFARLHPDVAITLTAAEPAEAYDGLIHDRFDLAVAFDYDLEPDTPPEVVACRPLMEDPVLVAVPAGHPLARRRSVRLDRLAREPWIAAPLAGLPLPALRQAGGTGFTPTVRYVGEDFATVLALVSAGLGVALLPRLATATLSQRITTIPLTGTPVTRRIWTARLHSRHPAVVATFDDLLRAREPRAGRRATLAP
jgi:DNA-binding transcriptional LysR family regulator